MVPPRSLVVVSNVSAAEAEEGKHAAASVQAARKRARDRAREGGEGDEQRNMLGGEGAQGKTDGCGSLGAFCVEVRPGFGAELAEKIRDHRGRLAASTVKRALKPILIITGASSTVKLIF
jgi:hypothetical protein